ncbi:MAG: hypothetical protein NC419_05525 [Muribaculaceae bacterium]|nr:hypothetical protein [Muribaculaceae bacterium]
MIMRANPINVNSIYENIKVPIRSHITDGQEPITEDELERRRIVAEELETFGISISKFDVEEDGHEDKDILQAIILANQGKQIPEELRKRLLGKKELKQKEGYAKNK